VRQQAEQLLRKVYGPRAQFRSGQWEAIDILVRQRNRVLVVQQTGWGKSLVYFMATRLLRNQGYGPTVIVSPLLALMRNQQDAANKLGLQAATFNSDNREDWPVVRAALGQNEIDLILVSPEQLNSAHFINEVLPAIHGGIGLLVVDEAHCISDWGHDFRPDYRRIIRIVQGLPSNVPVLATTATANDRVVADVRAQLGPQTQVMRGPLLRESLRLQNIRLADQAERLAWLAEHIPNLPGTGIIYCLTKADCERVAAFLNAQGLNVAAYHGGLQEQRRELEEMLQQDKVKALVATVALGMGYDKQDLRFVVHYQRPGSVVAYYQQVGRAGRDGKESYGILLSGREDDEIQEYFVESAFPTREATEEVIGLLTSESLSVPGILARCNQGKGQVERILKLLMIDGLVGKSGTKYFRTVNPYTPERPEQERITALRRQELARMQAYVEEKGCLMAFLARELDDPNPVPCGRCANCSGKFIGRQPNERLVRAAITYLQRSDQPIEPRKKWSNLRNIPAEELVQEGRALCFWGDAGWGRLVKQGKYTDGRFDDQLVRAAAEMVRERWKPTPAPLWVAAVPSRRRPSLVPDFARRLAKELGIPYHEVLEKRQETPEQKRMKNSAQQEQNVQRAFGVRGAVPAGPVLLIDDVVDSRWTLTVCGALLRRAGSGPVFPLALAVATTGGDSD
jgi:ATP-dependent DNA helicase RecQ